MSNVVKMTGLCTWSENYSYRSDSIGFLVAARQL